MTQHKLTTPDYLLAGILLSILGGSTVAAPGRPNLIGLIKQKVNGDEECVRTSFFSRQDSGLPCKNLGQCYKYRCGAIARHCSSCGEENKGPCIDYSATTTTTPTKQPRSVEELPPPPPETINYTMDYLYDMIFQELDAPLGSVDTNEAEPPLQPVLIETIGNAIVHLRAGNHDCAGFIASVRGTTSTNFLVMTSAQCLTRFEVECLSERTEFGSRFKADTDNGTMVEGFMNYRYNHSIPCFGDYDSDVSQVRKGFRSYVITVTSYTGSTFEFPLNSDHVIVPRDYMECQDCRNDFAAIKISETVAAEILRGSQPFKLSPRMDPMDIESNNVPNFVTVKAGYPPSLLRRAADVQFCTVNHSTKQKMCFSLPVAGSDSNPDLLLGSPVFLAERDKTGQMQYHCIGIFTGFFAIFEQSFSTNELKKSQQGGREDDVINDVDNDVTAAVEHDGVNLKYSNNGAVRITQEMVAFLRKLCQVEPARKSADTMSTLLPHPRRDCYPKVDSPLATEDQFCLCALGWTDEGSGCTKGDVTLGESCNWDGRKFSCTRRMRSVGRGNSREVRSSIIRDIMVPGTTKHLDLRGQYISDVIELAEMLRHVTAVQSVILDYNEITELPSGIFDENRELRMLLLKHNRIRRLSGDIFRRNKKLSHVNLANNHIVRVPGTLFRNAPVLQYLNLNDNNLTSVHPAMFLSNTKIAKLHMGNNRIAQLPSKLLIKQKMLREFWIQRNALREVSSHSFTACRQLMLVDVSYNRLSFAPKNLFDSNRELRFVNFNYNNFKSIPRRLFSKHRKLKSVSLSGNPLLSVQKTRAMLRMQGIPME